MAYINNKKVMQVVAHVSDGYNKGYEAGQESMIDKHKVLMKTVVSSGLKYLYDVSEIPHKITVRLRSINFFNADAIESTASITNNGDGSFTVKGGAPSRNTGKKLKELCPHLKVGDVVTLTGSSTGGKRIAAYKMWEFGNSKTITQDMLDADVYLYGVSKENTNYNNNHIVRDIQIRYAKDVNTHYYPYIDVASVILNVSNDSLSSNISAEYVPDSEGVINNVISYSPRMEIFADHANNGCIEMTITYQKSWGMQYEYDRFWDKFQNNGNRTDYVYAFAGCGWMNNPIFPPRYPIKSPSRCFGMFAYFNFGGQKQYDMTEICKYVDFSGSNYCAHLFKNAVAKNITLDLSNCTNALEMFQCHTGGSVDNITLKITEKLSNTTNMFDKCYDLKELRFTEDSVLATSLMLADCKNLSRDSFQSVFDILTIFADKARTLTLNRAAVNKAFETSQGANNGASSDYFDGLCMLNNNWTIILL